MVGDTIGLTSILLPRNEEVVAQVVETRNFCGCETSESMQWHGLFIYLFFLCSSYNDKYSLSDSLNIGLVLFYLFLLTLTIPLPLIYRESGRKGSRRG